MLDPQKTTLSKVKVAYGLNGQEADALLNALFPDGVFPYEAWREAYKKWGWDGLLPHGSAEPLNLAYIPDDICPTRIYAIQLVALLIDPARLHKISALEHGFQTVIKETYDGSFPFQEEKENLFHLMRQENKEYQRQKSSEKIWRIHHWFTTEYNFIHEMFPDTIVVDKAAAIRHLAVCGFPLRQEVKGITRSLVESIIKAAAREIPPISEVALAQEEAAAEVQPQEQGNIIRVPAALWEGKPDTAVRDAMRAEFDDSVIAYVLFRWCKIQKTRIGKLLSEKRFYDEKSYRNFVDKLLEKTDSLTITKG